MVISTGCPLLVSITSGCLPTLPTIRCRILSAIPALHHPLALVVEATNYWILLSGPIAVVERVIGTLLG